MVKKTHQMETNSIAAATLDSILLQSESYRLILSGMTTYSIAAATLDSIFLQSESYRLILSGMTTYHAYTLKRNFQLAKN
jgi:hypothetical protein